MEGFPKLDEEFKQKVTEQFHSVRAKVSDAILKEDGTLDTEKLSRAADRTYRVAGRALATGMTILARKLSDEFGVSEGEPEIIDTDLARDNYASEEDFQE